MTAIRETLAFPAEGEGGPGAPAGAISLSLSRRVAFPPWAPTKTGPCEEEGGSGAPTASEAAAAEEEEEDPFAAWIKKHRRSNSVVLGGAPDSPLTIVLRALRMPDAGADRCEALGREEWPLRGPLRQQLEAHRCSLLRPSRGGAPQRVPFLRFRGGPLLGLAFPFRVPAILHSAFCLSFCRSVSAATEWLTDNARDIVGLVKSRAPSARFLPPQESLGAPGGPEGPPGDRNSLLARCLSGLEGEFNRVWREADHRGKGGAPKGKAAGAPEGAPGRLWGLSLSGGACTTLLASHTLTVLCPSGALPEAEGTGALGGPLGAPHGDDGDAAPPGWMSVSLAREMTLGAANNITGR